MSELLKSIETIEYIDTNIPYSKLDQESLSPVEIKDVMIEYKKQERRQRYENCTHSLDEKLFSILRQNTLLSFDPTSSQTVYINDNGEKKKKNKSYRNCFQWDIERLKEELPIADEIEKVKIIEFLRRPKDITNEQAEDLLKDNPNTLVSAMTLLAHNYMINVERIIEKARLRQLDTPRRLVKEPTFQFTEEEKTIFLTGRTMLRELNKVYKSEYVSELIRDIDGVITIFNQGLVGMVAVKYSNFEDEEELKQAGTVGILKALEKYDIDKGIKFSTYATWWIRQKITRHLADHSSPVRVPVHMRDSVNRFVKAKRHLESIKGGNISIDDTIRYCNEVGIMIPKDREVIENILNQRNIISLDQDLNRFSDSDSDSFMDVIPDNSKSVEELVFDTLLGEQIEDIYDWAGLNERERDVINKRKGREPSEKKLGSGIQTLGEIGKEMSISRERVRQIEAVAMRKLVKTAKRMQEEGMI